MRPNRTRFGFLSLALVILSAVACAGNINPSRQIDDAILSSNVRDALSADPDLGRYDIVVNANEGQVTLLGSVRSVQEKQKAGMIAEKVDGVTRVINELRVN